MTTAGDIISLAARSAGILSQGQTLRSEDINAAFQKLNFMLSEWQRQRWLVYQLIDLSLTSTGATTYTVGPGGNFNTGATTPRPERLEAAFLRQVNISAPNQPDYPLTIIDSWEDYARIPVKQLSSFAQYVFLDTGFPLATLRPYPVPEANNYAIHLIIKQAMGQFTSVSSTVDLPAEYMSALEWNLALRLAGSYRMPVSAELKGMASGTLGVLRSANSQIARLRMPRGLKGPGRYNIYSDNFN